MPDDQAQWIAGQQATAGLGEAMKIASPGDHRRACVDLTASTEDSQVTGEHVVHSADGR